MNESEQKNSIINCFKAKANVERKKINPYIAIGAFIDEVIRELSTQKIQDQKISEFLINIAGKSEVWNL